ncbi:MAG: phosphoribosylamine--glycine ligase [Chloroflexi bacterium]|nr:phosphoribosylamine--glycine ligase [Chloroflexota bacterium]
MKVGLVGHGGREHAIARAIARSANSVQLYSYLGAANPGIARLSRGYELGSLQDTRSLADYFARIKPDLVIIGSEEPLVHSAVDLLAGKGLAVVGPYADQARLEADKGFMRQLMREFIGYGYPDHRETRSREEVQGYLAKTPEVAVKPVGLSSGKGVRVTGKQLRGMRETVAYAADLIAQDGRVLLEEKLEGEEFSLMVFSDGERIVSMPLIQDYKLAREGDLGDMTGGMGSYSCPNHLLPFVSQEEAEVAQGLVAKVIQSIQDMTQKPYRGVLYGQFMLTSQGPLVVEFNVRFGDPEAINALALLVDDFVDGCAGIACGQMPQIRFQPLATVCKYLVPPGYPEVPKANQEFQVVEKAILEAGAELYFGAVEERDGRFFTTGSRALAVAAQAATVTEAEEKVERAIALGKLGALYHRSDVGKPEHLEEKVRKMNVLRKAAEGALP